jgi:outer membrane protein W/outer membrane protein OmpA-like peptidoglycan-associated protein
MVRPGYCGAHILKQREFAMHSKILQAMVVATLAAAPLAVLADSAPGEQKGDWIVRAGFSQVNPKEENLQIPSLSTFVVVDSDVSFTFDVTYMFHNNFGVELLAAWPFTHGIDAKFYNGTNARIGDVEHLPPTLSLVWRPAAYDSWVQPYVGVGVNYTMFSSENTRGPAATWDLSLDDSIGPAAVIGADFFPGEEKKWFVNANVRWINIESDAEIVVPGVGTVKDTVEIDPMVYTFNIGRRFGAPKPPPAEPVAAPPPPPPPPPAPAKCSDMDNDGVCDTADKCPNTPAGAKVDKVGCPLEQTLKLLFDFDSAELRPESIEELERLVKFMGDVPFATALIEGHTDSVGSDAYNLKLSDRRAKSVFDYLTSRGVDPARLSSIGKGESAPIADNATEEGRQQNRRVMLIRTDSGM